MSDEVLIKVGLDASDALAAADALPGAIERKTRKEISGQTLRPSRIEGTTQYEYLSPQESGIRKYRERQQRDEQAASREKIAAEKEASKASQGTMGRWAQEFKDNINGQMVASFSAATLAVKGFGVVVGAIGSLISFAYDSYRSKVSYGYGFQDRANSAALAITSGMTPEELTTAGSTIQKSMIRAVRMRDAAAITAMAELGIKEEDFRAGKVSPNDVLLKLAGKYKEMQGGQRFDILANQLGLSNWEDLIPLLKRDEKELMAAMEESQTKRATFDKMLTGESLRQTYETVKPEAREMPLMGPGGPLNQMLSNVTSLQAMGGGDILSAIARGPQERTADAVEAIRDNTNFLKEGYVGGFRPPQTAIIGR